MLLLRIDNIVSENKKAERKMEIKLLLQTIKVKIYRSYFTLFKTHLSGDCSECSDGKTEQTTDSTVS